MLEIVKDLLLLVGLGGLGWLIFAPLRIPVPELFGTIILVGAIRISGYPLPESPDFLSPLIQVVLGLYVGSKVTRDTVRDLKTMAAPAAIIVAWALCVVFLMGYFLSCVTTLDPVTAMLSSSMGGLPEMTIIALAIHADIAVVVIMQTFRIVITALAFPVILKAFIKNTGPVSPPTPIPEYTRRPDKTHVPKNNAVFQLSSIKRGLISLVIASTGGWIVLRAGVPAGGMVGAMIFVSAASLLAIPVVTPPPKAFGFMLMGVGLMVSDNLTAETADALITGNIILPILISTTLVFMSALLVAFLIQKVSGWDFPNSFLAAAPGGFTIMTTLAIKYNKDPFRVSMLHLCRLMALKSVVPLAFMVYM